MGRDSIRSSETGARLAFAAPVLHPRPGLREKLLAGLKRQESVQVWREWSDTPPAPIHKVAAEEGAWEAIDVPGIRVKRLYVDPASDTVSLLIQMDPGASYPSHRHAGPEHCYVISGDLQVGGLHLKTGDYQVANTSSIHTVTSTVNGCTILIVSSMKDQLLHDSHA
ncbi:MAG: cupin domain-containing protein [Bryobacterales bacterium]|nr:cupin domain-containing protein [Bryobacterales bacterium]